MIKNKGSYGRYIFYTIVAFFIIVFIYSLVKTPIFIENSLENIKRIGQAAINPKVDKDTLIKVLISYKNTFIFSSVGLCIGIYLGLLLNYYSLRFRKLRLGKPVGILFRSTHEVVFMYILMLVFGLNVYIAVFAIGISFGGIISKIFTDNMNLTKDNIFYSYKSRGYSYRNNFFFNLFPSSFNSNLNYIIYRYECAIRSSIVLSYIGLPGIGFYINMSLKDGDFNALFTYLYSLIIFVLVFNVLISWIIKRLQYKMAAFLKWFTPLSLGLCLAFLIMYNQSFLKLFDYKNLTGLTNSIKAIGNLFNILNSEFYNLENMLRFLKYTWQTVELGIIATVFMLIFFFVSMFHYFYAFTKSSSINKKLSSIISIISRSIPEIVFLTFLLFIFKPSILSGALALALHNFGILVKLMRDRLESNYSDILTSYKNRGYKSLTIFYTVFLPLLGKDLISLISYRFEMMIKSSVVIGILGAGGLGYLLTLEMSKFNYEAIYFIVFIYVILFLSIDYINKIAFKER